MKMIDLNIVIPAYLEEENLKTILPKLRKNLNSLGISYEILVIDQIHNQDRTKQICEKNNVVHINRVPSNSYGDAVRTGISFCSARKIIFMDADGSHDPGFVLNLYKHSEKNDIVIASRYIENGKTENHFILIFMSRILNISYSYILGIPCKDISNSFKLYNSKHLNEIELKCNNFDIVEEIIFKIYKNNSKIKIKEIPFTFKRRNFGETKRNLFLFVLTYLYTIIKLRFSK